MAMGLRRKNRYCYRVKLSAYVRAYKMMYQSDDEEDDDEEDEEDEDEDEDEDKEEDEEDEDDIDNDDESYKILSHSANCNFYLVKLSVDRRYLVSIQRAP